MGFAKKGAGARDGREEVGILAVHAHVVDFYLLTAVCSLFDYLYVLCCLLFSLR